MEPRDRLDQWLDKGLATCGQAEPRAGLENRILANLTAEKDRMSAGSHWRWVLRAISVMVLTVLLVAVWLGSRSGAPSGRAEKNTALPIQTVERRAETPAQTSTQRRPPKPANTTSTKYVNAHSKRTEVVSSPRLNQFPSPRPLSDELLEYARSTPRDEIVAQVTRAKDTSNLQVRDLEVPPLDSERPAPGSDKTN
jgi:hypothetical protein